MKKRINNFKLNERLLGRLEDILNDIDDEDFDQEQSNHLKYQCHYKNPDSINM